MKQEGCVMKNLTQNFTKIALILCLLVLGFSSCKKEGDQTDISVPVQSGVEFEGGGPGGPGAGPGGGPVGPNVGGNVPPPPSACGDGHFTDLAGNPVEPTPLETFYEFYHGGSDNYFSNAIDAMSEGGARITAMNRGNRIVIFNGDNIVSPVQGIDSGAGQVHALKFFDGNRLAIGSTGHFRICNLTNGNLSDCEDFKAAGVTQISYDASSGNFYLTTMAGDFIQLAKDKVGHPQACARLIYRAADHMDNRPFGTVPYRAFRAGVANGMAYFLVRNNVAKASFDINYIIDMMIEWFSTGVGEILTRRTKLYSYNPSATSVTEITIPGSNNYRYFMDDLITGPDNNLHVSYWAPTERDIVHINNCGNLNPCSHNSAIQPALVWFAYFLNAKSGILKVDNNQTVIEYYLSPIVDITGNNYCDPQDYATFPNVSCLRIPNLGLFYLNRLSSNQNGVYMSGLFGLAWLKDGQIKSEIQSNTKGLLLDVAFSFDLASANDMSNLSDVGRWDFNASLQPTFWHYNLVDFFTMDIDKPTKINSTQIREAYVVGGGKDVIYHSDETSNPIRVQYIGTGTPPAVTELTNGPSGTFRELAEFPEIKSVQGATGIEDRLIFFTYETSTSKTYINFSDLTQSEPRSTWQWQLVPGETLASVKSIAYLIDGSEELVFYAVNHSSNNNYTIYGRTASVPWPPVGLSKFNGQDSFSELIIPGDVLSLIGAEAVQVNGNKEYWVYSSTIGQSTGMPMTVDGVNITKFTKTAPPTNIFIQDTGASVATFGGGNVYFVTSDGDLHIYDVAGGNVTSNSPTRTVDNFVKLATGHSIYYGMIAYANGHILMGAVTGAMAPAAPRTDVNFLGTWGDEQTDGTWKSKTSDVQPYLFAFGQEGILTGGAVLNGRGDQYVVPASTP